MADSKFFRSWLYFSLSCLLACFLHSWFNPAVNRYLHELRDYGVWQANALDCHMRGDCFFPWLCEHKPGNQHFCCQANGRPNSHREGCDSLSDASFDYVDFPHTLDEHNAACRDAVFFNPWVPRNDICLTALEAELCTIHRSSRRHARRLGYGPRATK